MANDLDHPHPLPVLSAKSRDIPIQRLLDRRPLTVERLLRDAQIQGWYPPIDPDAWTLEYVAGPNVTDRQTVLNLAIMSSDAYLVNTSDPAWLNLTGGFNRSRSFGWQADGIRGHVFANQDNSTIVLAVKGTERGQRLLIP